MKKIIGIVLLLVTFISLNFGNPAFAGDIEKGKAIFTANCNACHLGGKNVVNPAKTLSKADLEANQMYSLASIITQVTNGKGAMPSFQAKLNAEDIENVASYVLSQADKNWQ